MTHFATFLISENLKCISQNSDAKQRVNAVKKYQHRANDDSESQQNQKVAFWVIFSLSYIYP